MKICKTCGHKKEDTAFDKNGTIRNGVEFRRATCRACIIERKRKDVGLGKVEPEETQRFARKLESKRYLITAAQNATPVHEGFFKALEVAAKHLDAEIVVVPLRYKNPTSRWSQQQEHEEWWAEEVQPCLFNQRKKLNPNLVLAADVKTQPTASQPLSGFESLTGAESCILGHTKMQLKSVPVPSGRYPKILTTTGACTVKNYTDTKAGKLGAFHHYLGAIYVEIEGKTFHLRQLNASREDGSFIDLDQHFSAEGVKKAPRALALAMGDTHVGFHSPAVDEATFGQGGIVETLNPEKLIFHDILDGYPINPHHCGNPFISIAKHRNPERGDARAELEKVVDFLESRVGDLEAVIVNSNHDNFLSRWIVAADWKENPTNAEFYLETALAMVRSVETTDSGTKYADPFRYWMEKLWAPARCLAGESFVVGGIECGMHGDKGPNGARGSIRNLSRIGTKNIIGHSHTAGIEEGTYQVGTSTHLNLEYNQGPSSWQNAHCAIYSNGARSLIMIIDGKWRAKK